MGFLKKIWHESVEKPFQQTLDFAKDVAVTLFDEIVAISRIDKLLLHPDEYLKSVGVSTFRMYAEPLSDYTGREFAYQAVYYTAIAASLVAAWYVGPEITAAVESIAALAMESVATYAVNAAIATSVYYSISAAAMVGSAYLSAYLQTAISTTISESYFVGLYGFNSINQIIENKRYLDNGYSSALMDASAYDWMAGGIALNSVMAGGSIYSATDPYGKAFGYDGGNIQSGVAMAMPYSYLAGGELFGLNGMDSSPYVPLEITL